MNFKNPLEKNKNKEQTLSHLHKEEVKKWGKRIKKREQSGGRLEEQKQERH